MKDSIKFCGNIIFMELNIFNVFFGRFGNYEY